MTESRRAGLAGTSALILVLTACSSGGGGGRTTTPRLVATVNVGGRAGTPVLGGGYVWVPNTADGTISKIDQRTNRVVATIKVGDPGPLVAAGCGAPNVHAFPVGTFEVRRCDLPSALTYLDGSLWAARNGPGEVIRIDPRTDAVVARVPVEGLTFAMAGGPSGVWVADYENDSLTQIDTATNQVVKMLAGVGLGPSGLVVSDAAAWVALARENAVARIDPASGTRLARLAVGRRPLAMVTTPGALWVRNEKSSSLSRIDPVSNQVVATVPISYFLGRDGQDGIAVVGGRVWSGGQELNAVDPATNSVVERFAHTAIALAGGGSSLWTTDVTGTVSRIDV